MSKQGFLVKQGGSIKTWKKRWCVVKDGALHYSKSQGGTPLGTMELKGSIVKVHADSKRKHCFEIGTEARIYLLIAESNKEMNEWIACCKAEQERIEGRGKEEKKESAPASSPAPAAASSAGGSSSSASPAPSTAAAAAPVSPSGEKEKKKVCSTRFLFCSSRF
jgi:hypothetical protein